MITPLLQSSGINTYFSKLHKPLRPSGYYTHHPFNINKNNCSLPPPPPSNYMFPTILKINTIPPPPQTALCNWPLYDRRFLWDRNSFLLIFQIPSVTSELIANVTTVVYFDNKSGCSLGLWRYFRHAPIVHTSTKLSTTNDYIAYVYDAKLFTVVGKNVTYEILVPHSLYFLRSPKNISKCFCLCRIKCV
jgi:hypothetical protein